MMDGIAKLEDDPQNYKTTGVAARVGDLVGLQQMVWSGRPVDVFDNRGWSPLHEAAAQGFSGCLEFLLRQQDVDPNWLNHLNETPTLLAARFGHHQCLRALINAQANINIMTNEGLSPLFEAVMTRSNDCIRLLVKKGAVINHKVYTGYTPLHQAACMGNTLVTSYLLQQGAIQTTRCHDGLTPLFLAAQSGNADTVKVLLNQRPNELERRPDNGVVNMTADDNASPLLIAAQDGYDEIVDVLLHHGADPNIQVTHTRAGPLQYAIYCNRIKCMRKLLPVTDLLMFDQDFSMMHPLVQAVNKPGVAMLEELLAAGLNPLGRRPLDLEQAEELQDFTEGLVEADWKASLLCHFSRDGLLAAANVLLDRGLSPDAGEEKEVPPLLASMARKNLPLFRLLLRRGANPNVVFSSLNITMLYALHYDLQNSSISSAVVEEEDDDAAAAAPTAGDNSGHALMMTDGGDGAAADGSAVTNSAAGADKRAWLQLSKESFFMQLFAAGGEVGSLLRHPDTMGWGLCKVLSVILMQRTGDSPSRVQWRQGVAAGLLALCLCVSRHVEGLHSDLAPLVSFTQLKELNAIAEKSGSLAHLCRRFMFRHLFHSHERLEVAVTKCLLPNQVADYLLFPELEPYHRTLLAIFTPSLGCECD